MDETGDKTPRNKAVRLGVRIYGLFVPLVCLWGGAWAYSRLEGTWLAFPWAVTVGVLVVVSVGISLGAAVALATERAQAEKEALKDLTMRFRPKRRPRA